MDDAEGSFPCSQKPVIIGSYPEPGECGAQPYILFISDSF
jgi:hypothetical protein